MIVISVTDEPASLVEPWIAKHGVTHPVVILPGRMLESVIGVTGFPTAAVFHGKELQWKGSAGSSGSALSEVQKVATKESVYPKKLSKIIKAMNEGDSAKALKLLRKDKDKFKDRAADWATRLDTYLIESSERAFRAADAAIEKGFWFESMELAQPYLGKDSPFPGAADATAKLAELEDEDLYSKEIAGGKLYAKAKALEGAKEYAEAVKAYKSALKKGGDAQIAEHARTAGQKLIDARKPGFKSGCRKCGVKKKNAACDKHYEEIKL